MRNFLRIATGINVQPIVLALMQQPELWNACPVRQQHPASPHAAADDILVRFEPLTEPLPYSGHEWYPAAERLPAVKQLALALMTQVSGEQLGRVVLTRLQPGARIPAHADVGPHLLHYATFRFWSRYHIVLQTDAATRFRCDDEVIHMAEGECWYFRNDLEHEVFWEPPGGDVDRIHAIVDIHTVHDAARPV